MSCFPSPAWPAACCLLAALPLLALDPRKPATQYGQTVWSTGDGLPDNFVQALLQSADGYLWLGTAEGLVRFDGTQFTVFDTKNTPALKHNSIVALCETKAGALWIGTSGGGITVYQQGRFTASFTTANGLPNNYVRSVYEDRAGHIWITAHGGGLARFHNGRFSALTTLHGLPSNSLRTVFEDRAGTLWVGTDENGVCSWRAGVFRCFDRRHGLRSSQIRAFYQDRQGRLWVGTRAGGLHLFEGHSFRPLAGPHPLHGAAVRAITEDRDGNLWIGTEGAGVFRLQNSRPHRPSLQALSTRDGLPHSFVRCLFEDREGNLWIGTRAGLSRLRDKKVTTWTTSEGLTNDNARVVFEDPAGRVWIGTGAGISLIENGAVRAIRLTPEWSRDVIRSIAATPDGSVWIGADTGLFRWRNGAAHRFTPPGLPPLANVRTLFTDRHGHLWIACHRGLLRLSDGRTQLYGPEHGLLSPDINAIAEDRHGAIWLGAEDGLFELSAGRFLRYSSREGLVHDRVSALHADAEGALWIATRGGLSRRLHGRFASFRRRDGLLSDNLLQVAEDRLGHLWLSSRRGVSRISRQELNQFAAGQLRELRPVSFDASDGMKSPECNGEAQPAGARTRDGRMWFPTVQGVVVFDPAGIRSNPAPPKVVVERLVSGARSWPAAGGSVTLPAGSGDLEFQFTAISLTAPERVRFRYRLDGYDNDWIETTHRRSAWYTNLPPNRYRFRVMAYANDGSWPREESSLAVILDPRFYQTAWFYLLCAALAAAAAMLGYRLRIVSIHRRFAAVLDERARIGREIHDTLMQGVTGISLQLEVASQQLPLAPHDAKLRLDRALARLDEVLADARRTVLELKAPTPGLGDLILPLRHMAEELGAACGVGVQLSVTGVPRPLPEPLCAQLLRIAREAVTNSMLHAHASHLRLSLQFDSRQVSLLATDNGCGFDPSSPVTAHFGLRHMHERAEAIGGRLSIRSAPGAGTQVEVIAPAPPHSPRP